LLHKESQNIFKQIENERMEFLDMFGDAFPTPEEHWRFKSLNIIPHYGKATNVDLWLMSKEIKVETVKDLDKVPYQFDEDTLEECPDA